MVVVDLVAAALVGLGALRGLWIGLVREVFSVAALGSAVVVAVLFTGPASGWLAGRTGLGDWAADVVAGLALVLGTVAGVAGVGRFVRRGVRAAGLALADRLAGGCLGAAEGALAAALLLLVAIVVVGRDHPLLADSLSLSAFEGLEELVGWRPEAGAHAPDPEGARLRSATLPSLVRNPGYPRSTQWPCLRISSTRRSSASSAGTWRSTQAWPTYRFTSPGPEPT